MRLWGRKTQQKALDGRVQQLFCFKPDQIGWLCHWSCPRLRCQVDTVSRLARQKADDVAIILASALPESLHI